MEKVFENTAFWTLDCHLYQRECNTPLKEREINSSAACFVGNVLVVMMRVTAGIASLASLATSAPKRTSWRIIGDQVRAFFYRATARLIAKLNILKQFSYDDD